MFNLIGFELMQIKKFIFENDSSNQILTSEKTSGF